MDKNYTTHFQGLIAFSFVMIAVTAFVGIIGFLFTSVARHLLPPLESMIAAEHAFSSTASAMLFGVLLPLGFAFASWTLREHIAKKRIGWMVRAFSMYTTGTILLTVIGLYEVLSLTSEIAFRHRGLGAAREAVFAGVATAGVILYSFAYLLIAGATVWYAAILWKSLNEVRKVVGSMSALDLN